MNGMSSTWILTLREADEVHGLKEDDHGPVDGCALIRRGFAVSLFLRSLGDASTCYTLLYGLV